MSGALAAHAQESTCFGTVSKGRVENSVKLPGKGANFSSYSALATTAGRTYVHSRVERIVASAYEALERSAPATVFVYGETGSATGGRFRPHRTHQNGLSVDFFVPVLDKSGKSVPLPTGLTNRFGYDLEFNANGQFDELTIDFTALAEHLYQLHIAAKKHGAGISLVIFDPPFLPKLFASPRGAYLQQHLPFMKGAAWVRHDEHFHVDFAIPCKPLKN